MAARIITLPSGSSRVVGGVLPIVDGASVRSFADYVSATPTITGAIDYTTSSEDAQADDYLNTMFGDCAIAGPLHIDDAMTAITGAPKRWTDDDCLRLYREITGFDGTAATDHGARLLDVLAYWASKGLDGMGGHTIFGWLRVDMTNPAEVRHALSEFGPLYPGFALSAPWLQVSGPGFVWDVGSPPVPDDGHCAPIMGCEDGRLQVNSWGLKGWITDAAAASNAIECYAIVTHDWVAQASDATVNGVSWQRLVADLQAAGGTVPL